jgi:hypothetical protein
MVLKVDSVIPTAMAVIPEFITFIPLNHIQFFPQGFLATASTYVTASTFAHDGHF